MHHQLLQIPLYDIIQESSSCLITVPPIKPIGDVLILVSRQNCKNIGITSHSSNRVIGIISAFDISRYLIQSGQLMSKLQAPIEVVLTLDARDESYRVTTMDTRDDTKAVNLIQPRLLLILVKVCIEFWFMMMQKTLISC